MLIIILAFLVGHIVVGNYVRRNGGSAKLIKLPSAVTTGLILFGGVLVYVRG
jgi:hypothetical protein